MAQPRVLLQRALRSFYQSSNKMQKNTKTEKPQGKKLDLSAIETGKASPFASIPVQTRINMDNLIDLSVLSDVPTMINIDQVREHMEYLMYYTVSCDSFVKELDGRERSNFLFRHNYMTKLLTAAVWLFQDTESGYFDDLIHILNSEEMAYKVFYENRKAQVMVPDIDTGRMVNAG